MIFLLTLMVKMLTVMIIDVVDNYAAVEDDGEYDIIDNVDDSCC